MTGSSLAPIVIPIVVMFSLAAWIVMVFYAASHPQWRDRSTAVPQNMQPRQIQRVPARPVYRSYRDGTRHPVPASAARDERYAHDHDGGQAGAYRTRLPPLGGGGPGTAGAGRG
jgi:hypothetical protein